MIRFLVVLAFMLPLGGFAVDVSAPMEVIDPSDPGWRSLVESFAQRDNITANFAEQRWFPFRNKPVELTGEVRVSKDRGLSLHYRTPEQRVIIVDQHGLLVREHGSDSGGPSDPRATAVNDALLRILRLDLVALQRDFEVRGRLSGTEWAITLLPKREDLRRIIGEISVSGGGAAVSRIELKHSPKQFVDIRMSQPLPNRPFSPAELKEYFR